MIPLSQHPSLNAGNKRSLIETLFGLDSFHGAQFGPAYNYVAHWAELETGGDLSDVQIRQLSEMDKWMELSSALRHKLHGPPFNVPRPDRHSRSPTKRDGRGNQTLEHCVLQFCPKYLSAYKNANVEFDDPWNPAWTKEDQMYDECVIQFNRHGEVVQTKAVWERTDQKTMTRKLLQRHHVDFFEKIVGISMHEADLRLPDLSLLTATKKKKQTPKKELAAIKTRSWGAGIELKRPIRRIQKRKLDAEARRRQIGKKRKNPNADNPPKKRRRVNEADSEEMDVAQNDDEDEEDEDVDDEDDEDEKESHLSYFLSVASTARDKIEFDVNQLGEVGFSRSSQNNVHSTESWRKSIHQMATLACMDPTLPAVVVLTDLDPVFCSYAFWLSVLQKDDLKAPVVCMARIRYCDLPDFVWLLRKKGMAKMFPSNFQPMALNAFGLPEWVKSETLLS